MSSPSVQLRACTLTSPLKVLIFFGPETSVSANLAREAFDHHVAGDAGDRDRRAEGAQIEFDLIGYLNVEVGFDDVVVAAIDDAMVGVDVDDVAVLCDLELDVVEPIAGRAAHRLDDHLVAAAP